MEWQDNERRVWWWRWCGGDFTFGIEWQILVAMVMQTVTSSRYRIYSSCFTCFIAACSWIEDVVLWADCVFNVFFYCFIDDSEDIYSFLFNVTFSFFGFFPCG